MPANIVDYTETFTFDFFYFRKIYSDKVILHANLITIQMITSIM